MIYILALLAIVSGIFGTQAALLAKNPLAYLSSVGVVNGPHMELMAMSAFIIMTLCLVGIGIIIAVNRLIAAVQAQDACATGADTTPDNIHLDALKRDVRKSFAGTSRQPMLSPSLLRRINV